MLVFIDLVNPRQLNKLHLIKYHEQDLQQKRKLSIFTCYFFRLNFFLTRFSTIPNNVFNMEVTEALATCLLVTGQQCEMNQMNDLDSQRDILKEFQRCMYQIVQSALGRPRKYQNFLRLGSISSKT